MNIKRCLGLMAFFVAVSCTRAPLKNRAEALREVSPPNTLLEDPTLASISSTLRTHAEFLLTLLPRNAPMEFGPRSIARDEYARQLLSLADALEGKTDPNEIGAIVRERFVFMEVYGQSRWGQALLTSYYEPIIEGSRVKSDKFRQPLYRQPLDIVEVMLPQYDERFFEIGAMRGRVEKKPDGRMSLLPYYTRDQIDRGGKLAGKGLEICWVDPFDAFFAQVQGSVTIQLEPDKTNLTQTSLHLGYADQNGHRYQSIGKFLNQAIPAAEMRLQTIEQYLRAVPTQQADAVMAKNPSYVFFRELTGAPVTALGNPVFPGRTIAADYRFFPKGALAYLSFQKPVLGSQAIEVGKTEAAGRFVIDQDNGGAIRGGGRADLFWGSGDEAKQYAGNIRDSKAAIYYLFPKSAYSPK